MMISCGIAMGEFFFLREERRLTEADYKDSIIELMEIYGITFKDVAAEIYFFADLKNKYYVSVTDFDIHCLRCMNFDNMVKELPMELDYEYRPINNITKCKCWRCY